MLLDVVELQGVQVVGLGFVHLDELLISAQTRIRRRPTSFKIALDAVDFHDVPPRHLVPHRVGRQQRGDVHAVDVALDVFHQHVHPAVVSVDVQLAVPATGRVPADDVPHFVDDGVAHQRFVRVRSVQNPVVLRRHAQQRDVVVHPQRVLGLKGVRLLGEELRRRSADFDGDLAIVFVGEVLQSVDAAGEVGHLHVRDDAGIVENRGVCGDLDQRQRRFIHVHTRPIVLRRGIPIVDGRGVVAPCNGRARSVGGALGKTCAHCHVSGDVFDPSVVPIVGIGAPLARDVLLAAPILARAIGEGVVARESVRHLDRDAPDPVPVVVRHGKVAGVSKVPSSGQKHSLRRHRLVGHVEVEGQRKRGR